MLWHHVQLPHARKDSVDLFVSEKSGVVDILTGDARSHACFWASRVMGRMDEIYLDQRRSPVPWEIISLPDYCRLPEVDSRHNEMILGHEPTLDDLNYDIANAMNRTIQDRGFSVFVKKHLVGSWTAEDSSLNFRADGSYTIVGSRIPFGPTSPSSGRWSNGRNMLHLLNEARDRGIRVAIVSIGKSELRFHGRGGALFHLYEKSA